MNRRLALKTASYGVLHVLVATTIAYMLTGNAAATKPDAGRPGVTARAARACCLRIDSLLTDDDTARAHAA